MDKNTMIKGGLAVVIGAVVVWQIVAMMGGGATQTAQVKPQTRPNPDIPKPASLLTAKGTPKAEPTAREMQLLQMQQATEAKYIAALEQLQLLMVQKDIAEANKDIANANKDVMKAKKDSVLAQKSILEVLAPPKVSAPALVDNKGQSAGGQPAGGQPGMGNFGAMAAPQSNYTVVSVSYTRGKWIAVLASSSGKLYSVSVGDELSEDKSKVSAISRSGVTLDINGQSTALPMVSII